MRRVTTLLIILLLSLEAFAGDTGKLAGTVVDAATNEPLVGASVLVVGTAMGAATDLDGRFAILNVPPGSYTLRASAVGYRPMEIKDNRVSIDLTTDVNFSLSESAVTTQAVIVTAERPMVQKDLTASTAVVDSRQIQALPVTSFQDVLELQAGIYVDRNGDLHSRGGRSGEVMYMIDGVPVTDAYDGKTVVDVNTNSIQELQVVTGAYNAEYGQAMSGIVNIATKSGGDQFHGDLTTYAGGYVTSNTGIFTGLNKINPFNTSWLEGSLDGPIIRDRLFFYIDARYRYDDGYEYGLRKFNTYDISNTQAPSPADWVIQETGNGKLVSMNPYMEAYGQGKMTFKITPELQLAYNFILDNSRGKDFDWNYKYNPDGLLSRFQKGYLNTVNLTQTLGPTTFYTVGLSYYFKDYREYLDQNTFSLSDLFTRPGPFDQQYVHSSLLVQPEGTFYSGGTNMAHNIHSTDTYVAKFDVTSQVTPTHMIKAGLEFDQYQIFLHNINLQMAPIDINRNPVTDGNPFLIGPVVIPPLTNPDNKMYLHKPQIFSAYLQDKMEFKSLIVNVGLRLDWFRPDGQVLADPSDPNIYLPLKPQNQDSVVAPIGSVINGITTTSANQQQQALVQRMTYWYRNASDKWQLSPRLGIAFPITDRGIVHFSYGLFFQMPSFDRLYENPGYKLAVTGGSTDLGVIGNPDLTPEETTKGELGLQQQLTDDIALDITAYFSDIRNLAGTLNEIEYIYGGSAIYSKYVNTDFAYIRGIVLSIDKRFGEGVSATVDYTFQIAKGDASDPQAAYNLRTGGTLPETQLIPLDWDQRHSVDATFNYANPKNWGGSLIFQFGSGTPYTPTLTTTSNVGELLYNSQVKPATYDLSARIYKDFKFGGTTFTLFARIDNVLDTRNPVDVFPDGGQPDWSLTEEHLIESNPSQRIATVQDFYTRANYYAPPRRILLGITYTF